MVSENAASNLGEPLETDKFLGKDICNGDSPAGDSKPTNGAPEPEISVVVSQPKDSSPEPGCCCGRKCCCCVISRRCCGITSGVIFGFIALVVLGGYLRFEHRRTMARRNGAKEDSEGMWEKRLSGEGTNERVINSIRAVAEVPGDYQLKAYDENYRSYLQQYGTPNWVIDNLILGTREYMEIRETKDDDGELAYKVMVEKGASTVENHVWEFGREFTNVWGRNKGNLHRRCTRPTPLIISCTSEERSKNWKLSMQLEFTKFGLKETLNFDSPTQVSTKRHWLRVGVEFEDDEDPDGQKGLLEGAENLNMIDEVNEDEGDNPFSVDEEASEDGFSDDEMDDW